MKPLIHLSVLSHGYNKAINEEWDKVPFLMTPMNRPHRLCETHGLSGALMVCLIIAMMSKANLSNNSLRKLLWTRSLR